MSVGIDFPVITSNLKSGYGVYGTADPYNSALPNNGAQNVVGGVYFIPTPSSSGSILPTVTGFASGLWVKYVRYLSTANPAMVTGPAPVYYTDETFTTVSGVFSEGQTASEVSIAGWLLPNTGSVTGIGVGTAVSATILNNNSLGSYVFIGLTGFIPSAKLIAGAKGNPVCGASGNFTTAVTTGVLRTCVYVVGTVTSTIGDIVSVVQPF
jgi:hypothetical protein